MGVVTDVDPLRVTNRYCTGGSFFVNQSFDEANKIYTPDARAPLEVPRIMYYLPRVRSNDI